MSGGGGVLGEGTLINLQVTFSPEHVSQASPASHTSFPAGPGRMGMLYKQMWKRAHTKGKLFFISAAYVRD